MLGGLGFSQAGSTFLETNFVPFQALSYGWEKWHFFFFKVSPSPEHDDPYQTVGWKKTVLQKIPLDTPFHYFFFHLMYVLLFPLQYCAAYCKCKFFAASSVNVLYILATILLFFVCVNKSLYCSIIYKTRRLKHSNAHE